LKAAIAILQHTSDFSAQKLQEASQFCEDFVTENAANLPSFLQLYSSCGDEVMQYWLLDAICKVVQQHYEKVNDAAKQQMQKAYFQLIVEKPELVLSKKYTINKYALIFVLLVKRDFPGNWQDAFQELLSLVKQTQHDARLLEKVMFLIVRVMLTLDQEIVERNELNKRDKSFDSVAIKDGIRRLSINDIVFILT